jgi:hypothetical protein
MGTGFGSLSASLPLSGSSVVTDDREPEWREVPSSRVAGRDRWRGQHLSHRGLRALVQRSIRGAYAERVYGPWTDPDTAEAELEKLRAAQAEARPVRLSWLIIDGADVLAAYVKQREPD